MGDNLRLPFQGPAGPGPPSLAAVRVAAAMSADANSLDEPIAVRVARLQGEARGLAREHIGQLETALAEVARIAAEISGGGDSYHVGAREIAARLVESADGDRNTIAALMGRTER